MASAIAVSGVGVVGVVAVAAVIGVGGVGVVGLVAVAVVAVGGVGAVGVGVAVRKPTPLALSALVRATRGGGSLLTGRAEHSAGITGVTSVLAAAGAQADCGCCKHYSRAATT